MTRNLHFVSLLSCVLLVSALALGGHHAGRGGVPNLDECDSLFAVVIQPENGGIRLSWYDLPGVSEWIIYRGARPDRSDATIADTVRGAATWYESAAQIALHPQGFYWISAHWDNGTPSNYSIIEDFESPVELESYSEAEDQDPEAWQRVQEGGYNPFGFSLELYGNTWKRETIDTVRLEQGMIWQVAAKCELVGDVQAIGLADSANDMWYSLWGLQVRQLAAWNNIYQDWEPQGEWAFYNLPVGDDWMGRFGYYPAITQLLFANDGDDSVGVLRIDGIRDVTGTISLPPDARFRWRITGYPSPDTMEVAFCSMGCDPEGPLYREHWSFGDGTSFFGSNPIRRYAAGGEYSVALTVQDTSNQADWVVHQVADTISTATRQVKILFGGDVMMARRYESGGGVIPTFGVDSIFGRIRPLVLSADLATCNLECPLTNATEHHPTKMFYFKGRPEYVEGLSFAGFDYCALANNHNFDYLEEGMNETIHVLDSVGILNSGSGANDVLARQPAFFSLNGLCVAILSFCNRDGTWDNEPPFLAAGPSRPGFALWDRAAIEQTIPAMHDFADVVVVQVHSGFEYASEPPYLNLPDEERAEWDEVINDVIPDTSDVDLRHYAVDMGADLVINHHPHVIEGCEYYHGKLIAHSMGNFAFDQQFPETFFTMAISGKLIANAGGTDYIVHPIYIDRYIPGQAGGELAGAILDYLADLSRPMNTWIMRAPFADSARIMPAGSMASLQIETFRDTLALEDRDSVAISPPFHLQGGGYLTQISVSQPVGAEFRLGREVLWYGNMEDEGATPWDMNSNYEHFDSSVAYSGQRSVRLDRSGGGANSVSTNLLYRWPVTSGDYTMSGYVSAQNGREIRLEYRYWNSRSGGTLQYVQAIGGEQTGSFPWRLLWDDVAAPPENGNYFDIRVNLRSPALGEGFAWFDDVTLVRWEDWQIGSAEVPFPSNITFFQIRAPEGTPNGIVSYQKGWYYPLDIHGDDGVQ